MSSSVKTRKMTSHTKKAGSNSHRKSPSGPSSQRKSPTIMKYTVSLGNASNAGNDQGKAKQDAMPTPTRSSSTTQKTRESEEKVCEEQSIIESETHSIIESEYESEEDSVNSEAVLDTNDNDAPFANLGDIEKVYNEEIDPREVALSTESIPIIMLSFLTRIEKLEAKQETLEIENSSLKGSLDFAYEKIDNMEKREKENIDRMAKTQTSVEEIKSENKQIKVEAERNKDRNIKVEAYSRRQNLRFEGIAGHKNETNVQIRNKVYDILRRNLEIEDADKRIVIEKCHRDKKFPKQDPPSILVRFLSLRDRQEVWEKREMLNRNRSNKIFVNEDFPQEVERKRAFLRPYLKAAYASNRRATMNGDVLVIESDRYTVDTLHLLPDDLKPEKTVVKTKANVTAFYRSDAFLSNFHPARFEIEDREYCCVEQFYMSKKAIKFGDNSARLRIMASSNPREINYISKSIKKFDQAVWNESAEEIMLEGVLAKFSQNENLKRLLLETGNTKLVEASPLDKFWGAGLGINDEKIFDENKWQGSNKLGKILMKCRDRLR